MRSRASGTGCFRALQISVATTKKLDTFGLRSYTALTAVSDRPWRYDMSVVRWEPFALQSLFDSVFEAPSPSRGGTLRRWMPAMDLVEAEDRYVLRADLPGMGEDDIKIEFED